jgi:hypothetical protein
MRGWGVSRHKNLPEQRRAVGDDLEVIVRSSGDTAVETRLPPHRTRPRSRHALSPEADVVAAAMSDGDGKSMDVIDLVLRTGLSRRDVLSALESLHQRRMLASSRRDSRVCYTLR